MRREGYWQRLEIHHHPPFPAAEVERDGVEIGSGRFVVLHDPDGQEGWRGDTRVVAPVGSGDLLRRKGFARID